MMFRKLDSKVCEILEVKKYNGKGFLKPFLALLKEMKS